MSDTSKLRLYTKEELVNYPMHLRVGDLKKFLDKHSLDDNAIVMVQRVEDIYYEKNNWGVYLKKGESYNYCLKHNRDVESGKYLDKEKYPNIKPENLKIMSEKDMQDAMDQYHPAWSCIRYNDDKEMLFIDLHY